MLFQEEQSDSRGKIIYQNNRTELDFHAFKLEVMRQPLLTEFQCLSWEELEICWKGERGVKIIFTYLVIWWRHREKY